MTVNAQGNPGVTKPDEPVEPPLKKMRLSELLGIPMDPVQVVPDQNKTFLTSSGTWAAAEKITKAMPRGQGVPLTILTGFLGAGKSTVLNYILKADHGLNIAVLINEFGEVDIDNQLVDNVTKGEEGEPVVLNNGCICCTVSNGFIDAVHRVLEQAENSDNIPDYFIVETTGLADPKPIMDSVDATELREDLYVDQVLTVVDSSAWSEKHYGSATARRQIEVTDTVLLSKTDLADEAQVQTVIESIYDIRPNARIVRSQKGYVPIAALFDLGVSLAKPKKPKLATGKDGAKTEKEMKNGEHKHNDEHGHKDNHNGEHKHDHKDNHNGEHKHEHVHDENCDHSHDHSNGEKKSHLEEEGFTSISFVSELPFSLRRFKNDFMDSLPRGVFRSKGLLWFINYDSRFVFHWSGSRFNVEEQEWPEGLEYKNQLVLIGRDLDKAHITKMLEECVVKPGEESDEELMDGNAGAYAGEDGEEEEEGLERLNYEGEYGGNVGEDGQRLDSSGDGGPRGSAGYGTGGSTGEGTNAGATANYAEGN